MTDNEKKKAAKVFADYFEYLCRTLDPVVVLLHPKNEAMQ